MKQKTEAQTVLRPVFAGILICLAVMLATYGLLDLMGWVELKLRVILGGILGSIIAAGNFWGMCRTAHKAAAMEKQENRKRLFQISYNSRLLLQGSWVVLAFSLPGIDGMAGALPLLFPSLVILFLRKRLQKTQSEKG